MKINKIAILLATYNGERFLAEQIDSIINQTNKEWILYIRDDGSTDSTMQILNKYEHNNSNIIILNDSIKSRGAMNSFIWLMENVNSDYYMFCDQDDVWLENKVEKSINLMISIEMSCKKDLPIIIHSDLIVVSEDLDIISKSFWNYSHFKGIIDKPVFFPINNVVTGCTMMFNLRVKMVSISNFCNGLMHDSWIMLNVLANEGKIIPIEEPLILYRQHGKNTLGAKKYNNTLKHRILNINKSLIYNYRIYLNASKVLHYSLFKFAYYKIKCMIIMMRN